MDGLKPIIVESIERIQSEHPDLSIRSIAVRIDPDTSKMRSSLERCASMIWHNHFPGTDYSFLIAITDDRELGTEVRIGGEEFHIPPFTLVSISGGTDHRTPPQKAGRRILISFATGKKVATDTNEETVENEPAKTRKRNQQRVTEEESTDQVVLPKGDPDKDDEPGPPKQFKPYLGIF